MELKLKFPQENIFFYFLKLLQEEIIFSFSLTSEFRLDRILHITGLQKT